MKKNQQYGLLTTLSMVVGIVIGSGIFFKADDILNTTNGNVLIGVLGFIFVGIGVLFGAIVISKYAEHKDVEGGMIAYAKEAGGHKFGYIVGWFTISVYFPALIIVLAMVTVIYLKQLLGIEGNTMMFSTLAIVSLIAMTYVVNIYSKRIGGIVQSTSTILKLIPLVIIGLFGILFTDQQSIEVVSSSVGLGTTETFGSMFLSTLILIAFAFDGWIIATSISAEVKDAKKNLPRALIIGTIIITIIYVLYFVGSTRILDSSTIMNVGDGYLTLIANKIFGTIGSKLILLFVVISVYGGLNGMILAYIRLPHALVTNGLLEDKMNIEKVNEKYGVSFMSALFGVFFIIFFFIFQLLISKGIIFSNLENAFDISSIPVTVNYIIYTILYVMVIKVIDKKHKTIGLYICIAIAVVTSLIVVYGSLQTNGFLYILISLIMTIIGVFFYKKETE